MQSPADRPISSPVAAETIPTVSTCLLVIAHPRLDRSIVNARLAKVAGERPEIESYDLYEAYPDCQIDVAAEQQRLLRHEVIGVQFPLFWYSVPALLKEWFDLVWLHGFAYGGRAPRLAGKTLFCAVSTGGDEQSYREGGRNGYSVEEFLRPLERTAALCRMRWATPHLLHDAPRLRGERLEQAARGYARYLESLVRETAT